MYQGFHNDNELGHNNQNCTLSNDESPENAIELIPQDRQYSDDFEGGPVVHFTEQDDNGEEPSVSHDGSRLLDDLLQSVGPDILPSISSSSDEDDEFILSSFTSRNRRRRRMPHRRIPPDPHRFECDACSLKFSTKNSLDNHVIQDHTNFPDALEPEDEHRLSEPKLRSTRSNSAPGGRFTSLRFFAGPSNGRRNSSQPRSRQLIEPRLKNILDIPRDLTNLVFDYLHPMDWTCSCSTVNKLFWSVTKFKWGRVEIYALQGLSQKKVGGEKLRAEYLGEYATRMKTLIIENCGIESQSFIKLTRNLRRLQVLVLEWSPRVLMARSNPITNGALKMHVDDETSLSGDVDIVMSEPGSDPSYVGQSEELIDWEKQGTFAGQLRVVIVRGIGPHISSSAFKWLLSNSHNSLQHLTISRKDPTRCQRPGCGACTLWKFQACAQCKMATYCSRRCQKRHWRNHKSICQECAKSPRDRMLFDDILLGSIIQCTNLIRLDLSRTFRLDDERLKTIAEHCTKLIDVSLDGNHHISDRGVEPFVKRLPKLHTLRLNVCARIGNRTIEALAQTCADHLTVLELGCCYRVSESALMDLVLACTKLQSLNIACGFQRRQILWNFSDELAELILDHLVHLKVLYVVSTISLSDEVRRKLDDHPNLRVYSALTLAPPLDPQQVHHIDHHG